MSGTWWLGPLLVVLGCSLCASLAAALWNGPGWQRRGERRAPPCERRPPGRPAGRRWTRPIAALSAAALVSGCSGGRIGLPNGAAARGSQLVEHESCGSCHLIPGKAAGIGLVGPPLGGIARRTILAGMLPNTPANLELWIRTPQAVVPGNTMPDMGLSRRQAGDIAAYLYTLK